MSEVAPPEAKVYWTLSETSEYLREDPRTTRRRIERGELTAVRLPGSRKLLFRSADVVAFPEGAA